MLLSMKRFLSRLRQRVIGDGPDDPYMHEYYLVKCRWLGIYLHQYYRGDKDENCHDHPWASISIVLLGRFLEIFVDETVKLRKRGAIVFRGARSFHKIQLPDDPIEKPVWTLFIRFKACRKWGFMTPNGWVDADRYYQPPTFR